MACPGAPPVTNCEVTADTVNVCATASQHTAQDDSSADIVHAGLQLHRGRAEFERALRGCELQRRVSKQ